MRPRSSDDPFVLLLAPPPGETPDARAIREHAEADARRVSDAIDDQLRQERFALKKRRKPVKVLLLGQSESGKSATLKNFQLQYARDEWAEEKAAWRAVIFLNLVRNIIYILDLLVREMSFSSDSESRSGSSAHSSDSDLEPTPHTHHFTSYHRLLKVRLAPLRRVQVDLEKKFGQASQEVYSSSPTVPIGHDDKAQAHFREFGIISRNGWKTALDILRLGQKDDSHLESAVRKKEEENYEVANILAGCRQDMKNLWSDPVVRQILTEQKTRIEDSSGFFLNDIDRIACTDYEPSDSDIVRARLRTVGVQEHRFVMGEGQGREWIMYDVGGTRSSRAVWASYFDDVDSIIFLSPISCFDETLLEDSKVNRLDDSFQLWSSVCCSPMLARTLIILFLNKCDLLRNKLKRGVRIKDSIPTYGDRKNDVFTAMKYFQSHFKDIFKRLSPEPRPFFIHFTSVIGTTIHLFFVTPTGPPD